jgi:hypothetical protein
MSEGERELAPIVLFVYNRPWHTQQTIEALQKNDLAKESELFIYCDAAKDVVAKRSVDDVRSYVKSINGFKKIIIIERESNWGLADSIIDGVTSIVNEFGKIIVLEDDLVTSSYFLMFMNEALSFYQVKEKVWHVSGYKPPIEVNKGRHFFLGPTSCWGWATWSDRWQFFKKDSHYFLSKFNASNKSKFNINNSYDYYSHIELNHSKKMNTWAIFWYASVFFKDGLSLHPYASLVKNIGHDNSGTNCGTNNDFDVELANEFYGSFPSEIECASAHEKSLEHYYKGLHKSLAKRIFLKIKYFSRMDR